MTPSIALCPWAVLAPTTPPLAAATGVAAGNLVGGGYMWDYSRKDEGAQASPMRGIAAIQCGYFWDRRVCGIKFFDHSVFDERVPTLPRGLLRHLARAKIGERKGVFFTLLGRSTPTT